MNSLNIIEPEENEGEKVKREDLWRIVKAWKILKGIPTEGPRSKAWDQANGGRIFRSAKTLLLTFGDWKTAVGCIDFVYTKLTEEGFTCTLETVVKRSDDYWEELNKGKK